MKYIPEASTATYNESISDQSEINNITMGVLTGRMNVTIFSQKIQQLTEISIAGGNEVLETSEGWSKFRQVVHMRAPMYQATYDFATMGGLRYWQSQPTPHKLRYLLDIESGLTRDMSKLTPVNIGEIAARDIESLDPFLADSLHEVSAQVRGCCRPEDTVATSIALLARQGPVLCH